MKQFSILIKYLKEHQFEALLILFAFFLPLRNNISGIILYFMLLHSIINLKDFKLFLKQTFKQRFFYVAIFLSLIHLIGLIYTTNFRYAFKDIDIKLPLLLFPILIIGRTFSEIAIKKVLYAFIIGCIIGSIGAFSNAITIYSSTGNIRDMLYDGMNFVMHSSYFALYLIFCLGYLLTSVNVSESSFSVKSIARFLLILFFIIVVILLNSRAGILSLGVSFLFLIFYIFREKRLKQFYFLLTVLALTFLIMVTTSNKIFKRFTPVKHQTEKNKDVSDLNSKDSRLAILTVGIEVFKNSPIIGYGTGDVKDELIKGFRKFNFIDGYEKNYNAHNQYLQFLIAFGIIGLIVFLFTLFYPSFIALQTKNYLFLFLIVLIGFNFLFESMLETKAGVEFFAFFYSLLFFQKRKIRVSLLQVKCGCLGV